MVDLKRQYLLLREEIEMAVQEVMDSTRFILGPNVSALEEEIASFLGVSFALGVASGTDALLLALKACGVGAGDEVITSPFTFIATAEAVSYLGARPVFADISLDTYNIDPDNLEEKITARTKAILPVHLFGHPADMKPIAGLADKYGLKIIEDCAQAFGAAYGDRMVGSIGHCGCFSFFPSKNLAACGDGGMIVTDDAATADRIRILRNHGSSGNYRHECIGYNSRLDEIQAAVLRVKLRRIGEFNEARRRHAATYRELLVRDDLVLPLERPGCRHVYHQFTIRSEGREGIKDALAERGIASAVYYPLPLHRQPPFAAAEIEPLANSETCAEQVLSLPMFPELEEEEIRFISQVINHVP